MTPDTDWQHDQLSSLAKRMVELERLAAERDAAGDPHAATELRRRRELVQWQRSSLLRDVWQNARESSLVKQ
jgi:hypothetical protein